MIYLIYGEKEQFLEQEYWLLKGAISKEIREYKFDCIDGKFHEISIELANTGLWLEKRFFTFFNFDFAFMEQNNFVIIKKLILNNTIDDFIFIKKTKNESAINFFKKNFPTSNLISAKAMNWNELKFYLKKILEKNQIKMTEDLQNKFLKLLPNDINIINNEVLKIAAYDDEINENNLKLIVGNYFHSFHLNYLIEAFFNNDEKTIANYFLNHYEENHIFYILGAILNKLFLLYKIKALLKQKYKEEDIQNICEIELQKWPKYKIWNLNYNKMKLINCIEKIQYLESMVKCGIFSKGVAFRNFFWLKEN